MKNEKSKKEKVVITAVAVYNEELKRGELKPKISRPIRVHSSHIRQRDKLFFNLRRGFTKLNVRRM